MACINHKEQGTVNILDCPLRLISGVLVTFLDTCEHVIGRCHGEILDFGLYSCKVQTRCFKQYLIYV